MSRTMTVRRIIARCIPSLGYARCMHCRMPWSVTKPHDVYWTPTDGMFVVCEYCWPRITIEERVAYARDMVFRCWGMLELVEWQTIERAFRDGGHR